MAVQVKLRRGTAAQWAATNPVLANGEIVAETDTLGIKIGDGTTAYNFLPYVFPGGSIVLESFFF